MARRATGRKAGTQKTARKRVTRSRAAARPAPKARRAAPKKKAASRTQIRAKAPAKRRTAPSRRVAATPRERPIAPEVGPMTPEPYSSPQPISPVEPIRHDPWSHPVHEEHQDDLGVDDEDEDEDPL